MPASIKQIIFHSIISIFGLGGITKHLMTAPHPPKTVSFVSPKPSKIEQTAKRYLFDAGWHTNLGRFQGARPDNVRVESSNCCFPRELVSFDRPKELVSFDP